jgi:hypothetical protein
MAIIKIELHRIIHSSESYGSGNENVVSRVEFSMELDRHLFHGLSATIKQPVGSDYRTIGLEISRPLNYHGPFNYRAFHDAVNAYYRDALANLNAREGRDSSVRNYIYERTLAFECEVDTTH